MTSHEYFKTYPQDPRRPHTAPIVSRVGPLVHVNAESRLSSVFFACWDLRMPGFGATVEILGVFALRARPRLWTRHRRRQGISEKPFSRPLYLFLCPCFSYVVLWCALAPCSFTCISLLKSWRAKPASFLWLWHGKGLQHSPRLKQFGSDVGWSAPLAIRLHQDE